MKSWTSVEGSKLGRVPKYDVSNTIISFERDIAPTA